MSKTAYNKIISKLERLDEYLKILKEIQKVNKKKFTEDFHFYGLAERYFQLSIEIVLDVGKLILVAKNLKRAEDNSDIFEILNANVIISKKLFYRFAGINSFRNILVHDYEKIDREIVYKKLQTNLEDFFDFKKEIAKFLKKEM
ncbi:MAG: DUF86 domain-containing protein [Patescibacteria group bacterium]